MDTLGPDAPTQDFDGKVVQERFEVDASQSWSGMSMSVHGEHEGTWRQAWVDQSGSRWHFIGDLVDGDPSFGTPEPVDADQLYKGVVFSDMAPDGFPWRWESSPDRIDWTVNWAITYTRRGGHDG